MSAVNLATKTYVTRSLWMHACMETKIEQLVHYSHHYLHVQKPASICIHKHKKQPTNICTLAGQVNSGICTEHGLWKYHALLLPVSFSLLSFVFCAWTILSFSWSFPMVVLGSLLATFEASISACCFSIWVFEPMNSLAFAAADILHLVITISEFSFFFHV